MLTRNTATEEEEEEEEEGDETPDDALLEGDRLTEELYIYIYISTQPMHSMTQKGS